MRGGGKGGIEGGRGRGRGRDGRKALEGPGVSESGGKAGGRGQQNGRKRSGKKPMLLASVWQSVKE